MNRFSVRSIELARQLRAKALGNLGRPSCKWCSREVEPRISFGESYWRHMNDRTSMCFMESEWHEVEPRNA